MNALWGMTPRRRLRNLALLEGAGLLFWLPIEDLSTSWVIGFAILLSTTAAAWAFMRLQERRRLPGWMLPLAGLLAGLAVTPFSVFLMAFKSGLHGHTLPDFTPAQVASVLARTPVWTGAGLLIGLGLGLWRQART